MNKIRTLIIDDESLARDLLRHYLSKDERVELVGECSNGFEGVLAIQELNPDLVFLDIQMPKITGFEMLELIPNPPVIIFSTAYDQFAIRAFEANAIDYLLKPYPFERVVAALNKAVEKLKSKTAAPEIERLIETHDEDSGMLNRVVEQHLDGNQFVRIHRSYLLNLSYISEIQQYEKESWIVLTKQGAKLKVSKTGYTSLKEKLK